MSLFGRLKNIFTSNSNSNNDNKKRQKHSLIKFDADPNELWDIVGELGDGAFGKVYKTKHKVKQIFAALKQVDINDETELDDYSVEIDILHQCQHRNIVGLYEAYFFNGKLWMFIEFCGGGALDGIMLELEKPLTEPQIRYVCREMCEALNFLHEHFVIHRDLKAGNVLLTCEGEVKLADFGVSARNSSYRQKRDTFIGTPYWMAPEVILCETIKDSPYDFKADIWSFGITLIEFAQIEPPNHEMHPMRVLVKIQKSDPPTLKFPSRWSKEFNDFVTKCLSKDPEQRPTAVDLLQHPFIRDVKGNQAIMELVSEANAEIICEEKDLDDDLDEGIESGTTTDVDSDSVSTASGSNILKPNGAEEDNVSDTSPAAGDAGKGLPSVVVVGVSEEDTPKSPSSKETEKQKPAASDYEKGLKAGEPDRDSVTEGTSPDGEEPVILRKKKPPPPDTGVDKTPSPEDTADSPTGQKKYRTLTKTRKYLVNGEVVMSKVSKIIVPGSATDKKQQEHQLWKADLRELKLLHKQEKKLLQDMDLKSLAAIDEQNRKFEQDNGILLRNAEYNLDQSAKQHKQQMDRMTVNHATEMRNMQKRTKLEQDKDLRSFNEGLKQELKLLKQEVDLMPKEVRKDAFQKRKREKEIEHAEKERKFIETQKENMVRVLKRVEDQQKDQVALAEKQYLQLKQQTIRAREVSLWEAEVSQWKDRNRLNVQQLDSKFMLKKQLMLTRHAKEMEQVQRINMSKEDELTQCHLLENKRLPKIMKNEGKTRALMFKQSLRISVMGITADQEKERLKQFEETEKRRLKDEETRLRKKHRRQMDELKAKNEAVVKDLEQVHAEKRKMLDDNEAQKRKELEDQFQTGLNNMQLGLIPKKEALEAAFVKEMTDNEQFYANGSSVDQDSGRGLVSGVSQIISATPAAQTPAKFTPLSAKKLPASEVPKELTLPVMACSKAPARVSEEKAPAPVTKVPEKTVPVATVKVPEEKLPIAVAKVSEEKVHVPASKVAEETVHVATVKVHEEKVPVPVTKEPAEKVHVPVSKVPEEKPHVPTAIVSEEKVHVPVAKVREESIPLPTTEVSEEKLRAAFGDSFVMVGDPEGDPSVGGCHVGISSEDNYEKSSKIVPASMAMEEKDSSGVAVTPIEIETTDGGTSESKASEPPVPCHTSSDTIALISLQPHQEVPPLIHQSSNEESSNAHSKVAVELLQADAIATDALPSTILISSSRDDDLVEKAAEPCSKLDSGEEDLLSSRHDITIKASSMDEALGEKLPTILSSTTGLSSALTESSTEKFVTAEVSGSQEQDEGAVEERAECQTEVSLPSSFDQALITITTELDSELPATDIRDEGHSHGSANLDEPAKTKVFPVEAIDSHQANNDIKLHKASDCDVETHVSLESSHPHHDTGDTAYENKRSRPEKHDIDLAYSDKETTSSVQEQIVAKLENSEATDDVNLEKSENAFALGGEVHKKGEVCDSVDEKIDSPKEVTHDHSHDHSDHCEKTDSLIEFIKPDPQVIDSSHGHDDGHHDKRSEIELEKSSSGKGVDNEESLIDLSTDETPDASCEQSDHQEKQNVLSSHEQEDDDNLFECSDPCLVEDEEDDCSDDEQTGSSGNPVALLAEATGTSKGKGGSLHGKSESSDEKNDDRLEDPVKKE